jgi:hypothetical protein
MSKLRTRGLIAVAAFWLLSGCLWVPAASATVTSLYEGPSAEPAEATGRAPGLISTTDSIEPAPHDQWMNGSDPSRKLRAGGSAASPRQLSESSSSGDTDEPSKPKIATVLLVAVGLLGLLYNYGRRRL